MKVVQSWTIFSLSYRSGLSGRFPLRLNLSFHQAMVSCPAANPQGRTLTVTTGCSTWTKLDSSAIKQVAKFSRGPISRDIEFLCTRTHSKRLTVFCSAVTICNSFFYQRSALAALKQHQQILTSALCAPKCHWPTVTCWLGALRVVWFICERRPSTTVFRPAFAAFSDWGRSEYLNICASFFFPRWRSCMVLVNLRFHCKQCGLFVAQPIWQGGPKERVFLWCQHREDEGQKLFYC